MYAVYCARIRLPGIGQLLSNGRMYCGYHTIIVYTFDYYE